MSRSRFPRTYSEPRSWSEHLQQIQKDKQQATINAGFTRDKHVRSQDVEKTVFNPLLQKYRDTDQETTVAGEEWKQREAERERAVSTSNRYGSPFNILSGSVNRPLQPQEMDIPREIFISDSRVSYNIVNMQPRLLYVDGGPDEEAKDETQHTSKRSSRPSTASSASYNIITNTFFDGHDDKITDEKARANVEAEKKLKSRALNPVVGKYWTPETEDLQRKKEERIIEIKKQVRENHLPPYARVSLGRVYDITRHTIIDAEGFAQWCWRFIESKRTPKLFSEAEFKSRMEYSQELQLARSCHRISQHRVLDIASRGYDIISLEPLDKDQASPYHPQSSATVITGIARTAWDKCISESQYSEVSGTLPNKPTLPKISY
eukprot:TRINITY_DN2513_c0_g1_i10.p1 TRINITY_DN2513_c0_g1~~TRINITY_DN2513_c0_g1_i10.p1  ORF type:complete len:377 (+),score=65.14 TRINITY_DN2513_c0_g1_i10:91-1221(+)